MRTPRLNRQLLLETRVAASDGLGGVSESWEELGYVWAAIDIRSGSSTNGETGPVSRNTYRITMRAAPVGSEERPIPGQRLREGSRVYLIDAVGDQDAAGRFLTCYATEEVAA